MRLFEGTVRLGIGLDELLSELNSRLTALDLSKYSRSRSEGTTLITQTIEDVAKRHLLEYDREVFVGARRMDGKRGLCDFALITPDGKKIVIEIDSSNKKWSLTKLIEAHHLGNDAIWIRWNYPIKLDVPDCIHVIDLTCKKPPC